MNQRSLSRRRFLRGAGGVVLALPFLEYFSASAASAAPGGPKRLIVFYHHQGTILRHWAIPGASETDFTLGQIMQPLEPFKSRMLYLFGVHNKITNLNRSNGHNSSARSSMTANVYSTALDGSGKLIPTDSQPDVEGHASGPSIDQVLAQRLRKGHPHLSVDLAIGPGGAHRVFYAGKDDPVESEGDPEKVFQRFFAQDDGSIEEIAKLTKRRLSVLDAVQENFASLRTKVGKEDQVRLDNHADKVREIELAIQNAKTCSKPVLNLPADYDSNDHDWVSAPVMMDLMTLAMSCDLAPVGTLEFTNSHDPFNWLSYDDNGVERPVSEGWDNWHDMVHTGRNLGDGSYDAPGLIKGYTWYSERFAELLQRLSDTPEDGGTMLDNTLVLWMSEFGNGDGHNTNNLHIAMAGNIGGSKGTGRCLKLSKGGAWDPSDYSTNQVFVTLLNAFGFDDQTFGWQADGVSPGPIPGVL